MLSVAIFALPSVIVLIATFWADRRNSFRPLVIAGVASTMIMTATYALLPAAHVRYVPVG
jgi:hypothetical protein